MPDYATIKLTHQIAVALSLSGFFVRGAASLSGAAWVGGRLAKTLPHVVDTVLLLSALTLVWMLRPAPADSAWLAAKIGGLLLYIGLGMVALRSRWPLPPRLAAWVAALLTGGWIVSVAMAKNPLGFFAYTGTGV